MANGFLDLANVSTIVLHHTPTDTNVPTLLYAGEAAVATGPTKTKLWIGDGTTNRLFLSTDPADSPLIQSGTSWTHTTAAFVEPAEGDTVAVDVRSTEWMTDGAPLIVDDVTSGSLVVPTGIPWPVLNIPLSVEHGGTGRTTIPPVPRDVRNLPAILGGSGTNALFASPTWSLGTQGILGTMHSTTLEPFFSMVRGRPGPTAVQSGDRLGTIAFGGYLTATTTVETNVAIFARASETWTAASGGAELVFNVTPNGTAVGLPALLINQDRSLSFLGLPVSGDAPSNAMLGANGDRALHASPVWGVGTYGINGNVYSDDPVAAPFIGVGRTRGTRAAPTPLQNGDILFNVGITGFPAVPVAGSYNANLRAFASENWTATAQGVRWEIRGCPSGSADMTTTLAMYDNSLVFNGAGGLYLGPFLNRVYGRTGAPGGINLTNTSGGLGLFYTIGTDAASTTAWISGNWTFGNDVTVNGIWSNPCDRRLKTIDAPFERGLAEILQLQPVRFHHDKQTVPAADDNEHIGLIADDVEGVMPELVHMHSFPPRGDDPPSEEEFKFLDVGSIPFVLINAIKEMAKRLDAIEART